MIYADFLGEFLSAHADALGRLAEFMSEDILVELLEDERPHTPNPALKKIIDQIWDPTVIGEFGNSPYQKLELWVKAHKLPSMLEFHVWAYPAYRMLIEASLTPESGTKIDMNSKLFDELIAQCRSEGIAWITSQKLEGTLKTEAEKCVDQAWIKFRAQFLKRLGRKTLVVV